MNQHSHDLAVAIKLLEHIRKDIVLNDEISSEVDIMSADKMSQMPVVRRLLDTLPGWLWQTDHNHRFIYVSEQFFTVTGIRPDYIIGKTRLELITSDGNHAVPMHMITHRNQLMNTKSFSNFEYGINHVDVGKHWFSVSGWPIWDSQSGLTPSAEFLGYVGIGIDVTSAWARMAEVIEQQIYLSDAMNALSVSVLILDSAHNIAYFNSRWASLHRQMSPNDYSPGTSYEQYLLAAIAAGLFPEAVGQVKEFVSDRIKKNVDATGKPFTVQRQNGIILSISVSRVSGDTKTAIISTEISSGVLGSNVITPARSS